MARVLTLVCVAAAATSSASAAAVTSSVAPAPTGFETVTPFYTVIAPGTGTTIEVEGPAATYVPGSSNNIIEARGSGGFKDSCSWWGGAFGTVGSTNVGTLQATCRTATGSYKTTSLDLNKCIVNDNGNLRCQTKYVHF